MMFSPTLLRRDPMNSLGRFLSEVAVMGFALWIATLLQGKVPPNLQTQVAVCVAVIIWGACQWLFDELFGPRWARDTTE